MCISTRGRDILRKVEIAQRDVYTATDSPKKVRRYVELACKGLES